MLKLSGPNCTQVQCPTCREEVDKEELSDVLTSPRQRIFKQLLLVHEVPCSFEVSGCKWIGLWKDREEHCKECDHGMYYCKECNVKHTRVHQREIECLKKKLEELEQENRNLKQARSFLHDREAMTNLGTLTQSLQMENGDLKSQNEKLKEQYLKKFQQTLKLQSTKICFLSIQ